MFKIGEFSKLSFISIRMLRYYHDLGLLVPDSTDDFTGYRYYSAAQLTTAGRIQSLREMGFSLAVVSEILLSGNDPKLLQHYLNERQTELRGQIDQMNGQLSRLESTLIRLGKENLQMNYTVVTKEIPAHQVASLRKVIPTYQDEGSLWGILYQELGKQQVKFADPCYAVARFHDEGYVEENVDVEIETSVIGSYQDTEQVKFLTVPTQAVASITFKGSYDQMREVSATVANWASDNHYRFCAPMFNIYIVSPGVEQNPDNWVTEVCFPIAKD